VSSDLSLLCSLSTPSNLYARSCPRNAFSATLLFPFPSLLFPMVFKHQESSIDGHFVVPQAATAARAPWLFSTRKTLSTAPVLSCSDSFYTLPPGKPGLRSFRFSKPISPQSPISCLTLPSSRWHGCQSAAFLIVSRSCPLPVENHPPQYIRG